MARIRTIKPEFPQSESMGRVSRDARLCFILLWTLADDEGRLRGNARMLASLLFPYDDDAGKKIGGWLAELSAEGCIIQYENARDSYLQIANWREHQKIDKPSPSRIPAPQSGAETACESAREDSRTFANIREHSSLDQGREGIKEGTKEGSGALAKARVALQAPTDAHRELAKERGLDCSAEWDKYADWLLANGRTHRDREAGFRNWLKTAKNGRAPPGGIAGRQSREDIAHAMFGRLIDKPAEVRDITAEVKRVA